MSNLLEDYLKMIPAQIDEKGIYPTPTLVRRADDMVEYFAMAVEAHLIIQAAFATCLRPEVVEQIVALDCYTKPSQGTTLDSCLILFHLVRGQPARVGVLEYSWNGGEPIVKPPVWDNPFWTAAYKCLANDLSESFTALYQGEAL